MRAAPCLAFAFFVLSCTPGVESDAGSDALLMIAGGTFRRAPDPRSEGGPSVLAAYLGRQRLRAGEQDKSFSGVLQAGAVGVAIGLEGDAGHWIVTAGGPVPETPDSPGFSAPLSFAENVPPGPAALRIWAVDENKRHGDALRVEFEFIEAASVDGDLVVSLRWDTASDLDLHVIIPSGVEIDKDNVSSSPAGAGDDDGHGALDFDSNADCVIDRRNQENVVFLTSPPNGRYRVKVDTFSLCDETIARYAVEARLHGRQVAKAEGTSTGAATLGAHGHGAGVLALEFDVAP